MSMVFGIPNGNIYLKGVHFQQFSSQQQAQWVLKEDALSLITISHKFCHVMLLFKISTKLIKPHYIIHGDNYEVNCILTFLKKSNFSDSITSKKPMSIKVAA